MADPVIWRDERGSIVQLRAGFYIRQPSSTSEAERQQAGRKACEAEGRRKIAEWNSGPFPMKMVFHSVKLLALEGVTTRTEKNPWTGVRHHECKGTGVAQLLFTIQGSRGETLIREAESEVLGEDLPEEETEWGEAEGYTLVDNTQQ